MPDPLRAVVDLVGLLDAATPEPLLVVGSLPPHGRDLDLLAREDTAAAVSKLLAANGFHLRGGVWARFANCTAQVVDLLAAEDLNLEKDQIDRVFADAQPIAGQSKLMQPAPHHWLLLSARRAALDARLTEKRRALLAAIDQPDAWRRARDLAPHWQAQRALDELEVALDGGLPNSWRVRAVAARA
ncbi:MAG: hypothetical protein ACRDK2_03285, partial [Solirubrobacteraceae bacterium]